MNCAKLITHKINVLIEGDFNEVMHSKENHHGSIINILELTIGEVLWDGRPGV